MFSCIFNNVNEKRGIHLHGEGGGGGQMWPKINSVTTVIMNNFQVIGQICSLYRAHKV